MPERTFKIVRIAGAALIAVLILAAGLHLLKNRLRAGAAFIGGGSFREAILPGAGERLDPYVTENPEERWGGCALAKVRAGPYKYVFNFKCVGGTELDVTLDPAFASDGYRPEAEGGFTGQGRNVLITNLVALMRKMSSPDSMVLERIRPEGAIPVLIGIFITIYLSVLAWWSLAGMIEKSRLRPTAGKRPTGPAVFNGLLDGAPARALLYPGLPLLLILFAAAAVRVVLARPGLSEVVSFFHAGTIPAGLDKHSVLYEFIKGLLHSSGLDPLSGLIRFNEIVGVLTVIPMYVFVARRSGDTVTALFTALFFAVHPVIARMSATDAHHPLLMFFWCSGMAVLSGCAQGHLRVFTGMVLLGMASVMRIEGVIYFISSMLILWPEALKNVWRTRVSFLAGLLVVVALILNQYESKLHAWGFEIFFLQEASGGLVKFKNAFSGLAESLAYSQKPLGPLWLFFTTMAILGCFRALVNRRQRWLIGVLVSWVMVSLVCASKANILLLVYVHRAVPAFMLQCIMVGAGIGWLVSMIPGGRGRSVAAVILAAAIAVAVPSAAIDLLRNETALGAEYNLLRLLKEPGIAGGRHCTVIYYSVEGDLGVNNPQTLAPGHRFLDCRDMKECLDSASKAGCVFYVRNTQCLFTEGASTGVAKGGIALNEFCAALERNFTLDPVREIKVNFHDAYGRIDKLPVEGVMGLYRVIGRK